MPSFTQDQITGLLLAGGLGRRMGGVDKGLQAFRGRPLAAHVLERLAPQVGPLLINANQNLERYGEFNLPLIGDQIGGFAGPLAGLHAGLLASETPLLVTAPCDSPFLPPDLVPRLLAGLVQEQAMVAVARCDGQLQPVFALVRREALPSLTDFLTHGGRKIDAWFATLPCATVGFPDSAAFANINTREELATLENAAPAAATVALRPHPATPCAALAGIEVALSRRPDGSLDLRYRLAGAPAALCLPAPQTPGPADNLWQHTCCEAFIAGRDTSYREFNFSPSGLWAAYDFADIRQRNEAYVPATAPTITRTIDDAGLTLHAHLPAALLPDGDELRLGLSAVIETADGHLSYWALAHTEAKPDFHRREAFLLRLPRPAGS